MSHVGNFPAYRPKPAQRRLAYYREGAITDEAGETFTISHWEQIKYLAGADNLLILTGPLVRFPYLAAAVADPDSTALLSSHGIAAIRFTPPEDKRKRRWLVPARAWFDETQPRMEQLAALRRLFAHCEAGVYPTPSSLGQALMKQHYPKDEKKLWRPNKWTWQLFRDNLIGGRVDWLIAASQRRAWGQDMRMAYPWAARAIPHGTACLFHGRPPDYLRTYFQHVTVRIPPWPLGPLPTREQGHVRYPTGTVLDGWWWMEELHDLRMAGGDITWRGDGYGFPQVGSMLAPWSTEMLRLRRTAPDKATSGLVKRLAVAAIGRFGVEWESAELTDRSHAELWIDPSAGLDGHLFGVLRTTAERDAMLLPQASYVHMQVRRGLYAAALPYARRGTLIATNYDEILTTEPPLHRAAGGLGGWKTAAYHNLIVRQPRWKEADDVRPTRPGFMAA